MKGQKMKRLIPAILASVMLAATPYSAAADTPPCQDGDKAISVITDVTVVPVCAAPNGIYYANTDDPPTWQKAVEDYKTKVAQFLAAQKKRLKDSVPIVWHQLVVGSTAANDFVKHYPYLQKYLQGEGTTVGIAESRGKGGNVLFVVLEDRDNCGTGGCAFTMYVDLGNHGYQQLEERLEFEIPIRIFRGTKDAAFERPVVSLFYQFNHKHAPDVNNPPDGTWIEWLLGDQDYFENKPPEFIPPHSLLDLGKPNK
jgi:hypothetical protein